MPKKKNETFIPLFPETGDFFSSLIDSDSLGHAYLFFGDSGVGKKTFAKALARKIELGDFSADAPLIDAMFLSPGENGSVSVDEIRSVRRFLSQTPLNSFRRVAIILHGDEMTPEAEAACLKIVEEPPKSSFIVIVAKSPDSLFPPLASRLQKIYFPRFSRSAIEKLLREYFGASAEAARKTASRAYGSLGRALALLKGKTEKPKDFSEKIEAVIAELRENNLERNAPLIRKLLRMQGDAARFNLNPRIQEKALAHLLSL